MPNRDRNVILSTPLLLETGSFDMMRMTIDQAREWVRLNNPRVYTNHQTIKVLGLEPSTSREPCLGYDRALCLKPMDRLEFGKEYTVEEILQIGVQPLLIIKRSN